MSAATLTAGSNRVLDSAIEALNTPGSVLPLEDVSRAIAQAPYDARLWHVKGLILREQDRRELAIPALRKAAELAPAEPLIAHGYARTLLESGLPSVDSFGRALKLSPNDGSIVEGFVTALLTERRFAEAIDGLKIVLRRNPLWAAGHTLLAKIRWTEGDYAGFTRSFDQVLAQHPRALDLRREQIIALTYAEQWHEVLKRVDEGRRAVGDNILFDIHEAVVEAELGNVERADALFEPFAELADGTVQLRYVRHLLRSGRVEAAARAVEARLDKPDGFLFWPYASLSWRMMGDERWHWLEGDPTFVAAYDIADRLPPLDILAETLRRLHTYSGQPLEQSLRGGTQTEGDIFQHIDPVLVQLREAVRQTVAEHVAKFPPRDASHPLLGPRRYPIRFKGAWSVRLQTNGFHANHVHPAGWISSALYVVLPPDLGENEAGYLTLGDSASPSFNIGLPAVRSVRPKPGRLVLFPSYMWHGTRPFATGERITVAFDVARLS